jgi:hypothetical protein
MVGSSSATRHEYQSLDCKTSRRGFMLIQTSVVTQAVMVSLMLHQTVAYNASFMSTGTDANSNCRSAAPQAGGTKSQFCTSNLKTIIDDEFAIPRMSSSWKWYIRSPSPVSHLRRVTFFASLPIFSIFSNFSHSTPHSIRRLVIKSKENHQATRTPSFAN